jgi:hypothetical protein
VNLTKYQIKKIASAVKQNRGVTLRLAKSDLQGDHKLPLTKQQISKISGAKTGIALELSPQQIDHLEKSGGFIPLLALLPALLGGLSAAGGLAGGIGSIVTSVKNSQAQAAAQAENVRHNREVENQLKGGSGVVSDFIGKTPVVGKYLKPLLQRIGLGIEDCKKVMKGECICMPGIHGKPGARVTHGHGLFLKPYGAGLYIGPQQPPT